MPESLAARAFEGIVTEEVTSLREARSPARPKPASPEGRPPRFSRRMGIIAAAGGAAVLLLGVILYVATDKGRIKVEINDPRALVKVDGEEVRIEALGEPISLRAGEHSLLIRWADGEIETRSFRVRRGGEDVVSVDYRPKPAGRPEDRPAGTARAPGALSAPADARIVGSKRFKVFSEQLTWRQARAKCEQMGGHLAIVDSEDENRILTSMISIAQLDSAWLGATDEVVEGRWVWVDGTEMRYKNWDPAWSQPNNGGSSGYPEHYLLTQISANGKWWDVPEYCGPPFHPGYVCQWDAKAAGEAAETDGFKSLFNGKDLKDWAGDKSDYEVRDGAVSIRQGKRATIYYPTIYWDFAARVEFRLSPEGNSGLAIRYPGEGDPAYSGLCEIQILDNSAPRYAGIDPRATHGSAFGLVAAGPGPLHPPGEWNTQVATVRGSTVKVELNGVTILDTDLGIDREDMGGKPHPGKDRKGGYFGLTGIDFPVEFRKVEIKELGPNTAGGAAARDEAPADRVQDLPSITNTVGMKLNLIPAGEFLMGSDETDPDAIDDEKVNGKKHPIRITKPFYLGTSEVTVAQFRQFVERTSYRTDAEKDGRGGPGWNEAKGTRERDPKYVWRSPGFPQTDDHPVVLVSWNDAVAFCNWLSESEGRRPCYQADGRILSDGTGYRLPTEAEWEHACRAGRTTRYYSGNDPESLVTVGNVADGTAKEKYPNWGWAIAAKDGHVFTAPVGRYRPNAFGLYDMHGNVWEWCTDSYDSNYYAMSPPADPLNSSQAAFRVNRGGGWINNPRTARSADRSRYVPDSRHSILGFRAARVRSEP
jgi:formylglycine-generating enzyme required for sulfatase activity